MTLSLVLALVLSPTAPASPRCSMTVLHHFRSEAPLVLAVATGEIRMVGADPDAFLDGWSSPRGGPARTPGFAFRPLRHAGPTPSLEADGTFTVVPWGYDAACDLEAWPGGPWPATGDTVVFRLHPTRTAGEGVYDVLGWHQPWPTARFLEWQMHPRDAVRRWLTPVEYFEFVQVLPPLELMDRDPAEGARRLEAWVAAHPEAAGTFPVTEIVQRWQRATPRGGR